MGFRFQKRVRLAPGITMNFGKTGCSCSFGPRGARVTVGKNGVRKTIGVPGTGLSYTSYDRFDKTASSSLSKNKSSVPQNNLDIGFFSSLFISGDEKFFIEGIKALLKEDISSAIASLSQIPDNPDACFVLAVLYLNSKEYQLCQDSLNHIFKHKSKLGVLFHKYNLDLNLSFPITDLFFVNLEPSLFAVELLRVEVYQHTRDISSACNLLLELYKKDNTNLVIKISLSELVLSSSPNNSPWLKTLITMTEGIENESPVHTVLLYYRGLALKNLKQYDAAQNIFTSIARKQKDRDPRLIRTIQEERVRIYELQGQKAAAQKILNKLTSEDSFRQ